VRALGEASGTDDGNADAAIDGGQWSDLHRREAAGVARGILQQDQ
jgi:hypothetical protein